MESMRFTAWLLQPANMLRKDAVGNLAQDLRHGRFPGWPGWACDLESFENYVYWLEGRFPLNVMDALHTAWVEFDKEWPKEGIEKEERKHGENVEDIQE